MRIFTHAFVLSLTMAVIVAIIGPTTTSAQAKAPPAAVAKLETRHWTIDGVRRVALVHVPADAKPNLWV
jgi:hypothetical protein